MGLGRKANYIVNENLIVKVLDFFKSIVLYCELIAGRFLFRMGQSAPSELAEMDFGRQGCSCSVVFPEGFISRNIISVPAATAPARARPNRRRPTVHWAPPRPGVRAVFGDQITCNIVARSEGIRTP